MLRRTGEESLGIEPPTVTVRVSGWSADAWDAMSPPMRGHPQWSAHLCIASKSSSACLKSFGSTPVPSDHEGVPPIAAMSDTERAIALRAMRSMLVVDSKWRPSTS